MLVRPPLPFIGNKSKYRGTILQILQSYISIVNKYQDFYIVDVFGGSGFCAYLARQVFPDETRIHVIYNDYDNYVNRLLKIDQTNRILQQCRDIVKTPYFKRLTDNERDACLKVIEQEDNPDIITLSCNFLYSANYCTTYDGLRKSPFYNKIGKVPYTVHADEYLQGIDVIRADFQEIITTFIDKPTLFIIDPPYLYSDKSVYNTNYWKLDKYMFLIYMIMNMKHVIFFSQNGGEFSSIIESLDRYFSIDVLKNATHIVLTRRSIADKISIQEEIYFR